MLITFAYTCTTFNMMIRGVNFFNPLIKLIWWYLEKDTGDHQFFSHYFVISVESLRHAKFDRLHQFPTHPYLVKRYFCVQYVHKCQKLRNIWYAIISGMKLVTPSFFFSFLNGWSRGTLRESLVVLINFFLTVASHLKRHLAQRLQQT